MCLWSSSRFGESNATFTNVEVGVEGLQEAVSDNEGLAELGGKVETNNTNNAGRFSSLINFENVVLSGKSVLVSSNDEVKSWEVGDLSTINLFLLSSSKGFGHILDNLGWEGSAVDVLEEDLDIAGGSSSCAPSSSMEGR